MKPLGTELFNYQDIFTIYFMDVDTVCAHIAKTHSLVYIYSGEMHINDNGNEIIAVAGECIFIRRDIRVSFSKLAVNGEQFKGITMHFRRAFMKKHFQDFDRATFPQNISPLKSSIIKLAKSTGIESLFTSLVPYFHSHEKPSNELAELKLREGVLSLLKLDPSFYPTLFDFTEPWKIDILDFLKENYMYELSMEEIASFTGRSLATFKRDFKKISKLTPQKWLIKKRLEVAYAEMQKGHKGVSEVCYEVGFKNRTHFAKIFKQEFGFAPSEHIPSHPSI